MDPCRPMLGNFVSIYEKESSKLSHTSKTGEETTEEPEVYRPPHLNPVFYEDGSAPHKEISREKRRAMKRLLEDPDIMEEEDLPKEIYYGTSHTTASFLEKMRERERYEEENFTRLPQSKRDKLLQKRLERGEMPFSRLRKDYINKILESSDDEEENAIIRMTSGKKKKHKKPKYRKNGKNRKKKR
ncbi:hypothetical protein Aperf_G00000049406 [Anoplocephala perfoliata]